MTSVNVEINGEIDLSDAILQRWNELCMSKEQSDVTFIIEGVEIPAHKTVLSVQCTYFRTLFSGGFTEANQDKIELKVTLDAFKVFLKYIYTGRTSLAGLEVKQIFALIDLTNQYDCESLKTAVVTYFKSKLSMDNCCMLLEAALLYSIDYLRDECLKFMDRHSAKLLNHDTLKKLSSIAFCTLLKRDTFFAPEIDIFHAVKDWLAENPEADSQVFSVVRWLLLDSHQLLNVVLTSLAPTQLLQLTKGASNKVDRVPFSSQCTNFASPEFNSTTIVGENAEALLRNFTSYDIETGFTYHQIPNTLGVLSVNSETVATFIKIKLGELNIINKIEMLLRDNDSRSYSYEVHVSVDDNGYNLLVDRKSDFCRCRQCIYFERRPVQFIKLKGTRAINDTQRFHYDISYWQNRVYSSFDVVALKATYEEGIPITMNGIWKPSKNMAKVELGAKVIEGAGGNNMLNENQNQFTCVEPNIGCIMLQLNQPYNIGSIRMLLGNVKNYVNEFSFYVETSMDKETWTLAVDKRNEGLRSWQEFEFDSRPATFIRIVCTQPDVSLICTYFECPQNPQEPAIKRAFASNNCEN